jgi:hypothetical protein
MALALIAGAGLAGCSGSPAGSGAHSTASTPISSPATAGSATLVNGSLSSTPSSASDTGSSTTAPSQVSTPLCTDDIRVIPEIVEGAAGHLALVLVFNNVSRTATCEIIGYPGVDLVSASGATVVHLTRTLRGMAGGEPAGVTAPQAVILAPGQSASALAEASDVPQGGISNCGSYSLLVTVPNQFVSVPGGTSMLPRCAAEIHPVVPGTSGGKH